MGSLCASKAALWSFTQGVVRAEIAAQGTFVVGVLPGPVETMMTEGVPVPKIKPAEVAEAALDAVESRTEEIYPSQMAQGWLAQYRADPKALEIIKGQEKLAKIVGKEPDKKKEWQAAIEDLEKLRESYPGTFVEQEAERLIQEYRDLIRR